MKQVESLPLRHFLTLRTLHTVFGELQLSRRNQSCELQIFAAHAKYPKGKPRFYQKLGGRTLTKLFLSQSAPTTTTCLLLPQRAHKVICSVFVLAGVEIIYGFQTLPG